MSPGGQQGRLIVQRDRPCTLEAGSSDKPLPDPTTTTLRPPPTGRFAALTNTPCHKQASLRVGPDCRIVSTERPARKIGSYGVR
jgi:hypothetical protein